MKRVSRRKSLLTIGALFGSVGGLLLAGCEKTDGPPADLEERKKSKRDVIKGLSTTPKKAPKGGSDDDTF